MLLVEDNGTNRYMVRFLLESAGYQVLEARDGLTGVQLALTQPVDLILMDIQLPDIDGLEAARRIRAAAGDQTLVIVALTSYAMPGDREKALAAGCNGYIEKPINPETFIREIDKQVAGN